MVVAYTSNNANDFSLIDEYIAEDNEFHPNEFM